MDINYNLDMERGPFYRLLSLAEAAEIWRVDQSTLRKAIASGKFKEGIDCRKFGKQWVIYVDAMVREYSGSWGPWNEFLQPLWAEKKKNPGEIPLS